MISAAQSGQFQLRLALPNGKNAKVACDLNTSVVQILAAVATKLEGSTDAAERLTLICPEDGPLIDDAARISQSGYVRRCIARQHRPILRVQHKSAQIQNVEAAAASTGWSISPQETNPTPTNKSLGFKILVDLPSGKQTNVRCLGLTTAGGIFRLQNSMNIADVKAKAIRKLGLDSTSMSGYSLHIANIEDYRRQGFIGTSELSDSSPVEDCDFISYCLTSQLQPHFRLAMSDKEATVTGTLDFYPGNHSLNTLADTKAPSSIAMSDTDYQLDMSDLDEREFELATYTIPTAECMPIAQHANNHDCEDSSTKIIDQTSVVPPSMLPGTSKPPDPCAQPLRRLDEKDWVSGDKFFAAKAERIRAAQLAAKTKQNSGPEDTGNLSKVPNLLGTTVAAPQLLSKQLSSTSVQTPKLSKSRRRNPATPVTPRVVQLLDGEGHIQRHQNHNNAAWSHHKKKINAFTWSAKNTAECEGQPSLKKIAEIAQLVGINKVLGTGRSHFRESLNAEFFRRRSRFRRSMRSHILKEHHMGTPKGALDLPGHWTRPSLLHMDSAEKLSIQCYFATHDLGIIQCQCSDRMLDLLKQTHRKCIEVVPSMRADPAGLVCKVFGMRDFLDGDECLIDYGYIRECVKKQQQPRLTFLIRDVVVAELKGQQAEMLNEDDLEEESDTDDETVDYKDLKNDFDASSDRAEWKFIPISELHRNFRIRIVGIDLLPMEDRIEQPKAHGHGKPQKEKPKERASELICVNVGLYYAGELLHGTSTKQTGKHGRVNNPCWNEWLSFDFVTSRLPRATRLCFTVLNHKSCKSGDAVESLGWVNVDLFDDANRLRTGRIALRLWQTRDPRTLKIQEANPIGTCVDNLASEDPAVIFVELDEYHATVLHTRVDHNYGISNSSISTRGAWTQMDKHTLNRIVGEDPLYKMNSAERELIFKLRFQCKSKPRALAKFLRAVDWTDPVTVQEAHALLDDWGEIPPKEALELLDSQYADSRVRAYAVHCLATMTDEELELYILQLVQVLKYEKDHDSPLACFLMSRALRCPNAVGHLFFWHLKAEMHVVEIAERYGLLLEMYLTHCGFHRKELLLQTEVMEKLTSVATAVAPPLPKDQRQQVLLDHLRDINLPAAFSLPLNPKWVCKGLRKEKCKTMDSKKVPLMLQFENADDEGDPFLVIFKAGDDLRQDMLTLQVLRIMDNLWQGEEMDLKLNAYGCVSTGDEIGFIEVVLNSDTCANITLQEAGGAAGVFRDDVFETWLRKHNPEVNGSDAQFDNAVRNFAKSCAGYAVATYVLGIGDRHNDNVMITKSGEFFHIDFGHFLGNIKKKLMVKRERAPFVFTPQMARVMQGASGESEEYTLFVEQGIRAYNVLRKNSHHLMNLFQLMLATGIPELTHANDINYLVDSLSPKDSEEQASQKFVRLIKEAIGSKTTRLNDFAHIVAHGGGF